MEPLDPKLARLVHDGMVQAVPGREVEDRVLAGLLARLPQGGPPGGGEGSDLPPMGDGASAAGTGGAAGTAAGGKAWVLAAVLGVATVTGAAVLGGRRDAEKAGARDGATTTARSEPDASPRRATPSAAEIPPAAASTPGPAMSTPDPATSTQGPAIVPREPASASERVRERSSASRRPADGSGTNRSTSDRSTSAPTVTEPSSDDLAAEIQQIAAADRALARGELRRALQLTREHATAHPHGQLALERTAIELGARCQLGEAGAAEAAARFLREHATAPAAAKVRTRCAAEPPAEEFSSDR